MGFFKSVKKAVKKVGNKVIKPVLKDAVPIAAGVLTGGASLAVLKPTNILDRVDKATGINVSKIANAVGPAMGGGQSIQEVATEYASEKISNEANRVVNREIQKRQPSSKRINSASVSVPNKSFVSDVADSVSETFESVSAKVGGKSNLMMIVGGAVAVFAVIFLVLRGRK